MKYKIKRGNKATTDVFKDMLWSILKYFGGTVLILAIVSFFVFILGTYAHDNIPGVAEAANKLISIYMRVYHLYGIWPTVAFTLSVPIFILALSNEAKRKSEKTNYVKVVK